MITKFNLFESFSDKSYNEIKEELIEYMMNLYELDRDTIIGIIEYENAFSAVEDGFEYQDYNALEDYIIDATSIEDLSDMIMDSDEGKYQLDLIEREPEKHRNYFKFKKTNDFNL